MLSKFTVKVYGGDITYEGDTESFDTLKKAHDCAHSFTAEGIQIYVYLERDIYGRVYPKDSVPIYYRENKTRIK